jgi:DNA-binding NtrC family response regulator
MPVNSVLVVDDEHPIRSLLSRWAQSDGYCVTEAASAEEALEEMSERPSAVAVCDIRMPSHDGFWLADQLRRQFPETAVIMATGVLELNAAVVNLRSGAVDCLSKPFTHTQLQEALEGGVEWHRDRVATRAWQQQRQTELRRRHAQLTEALAEADITSVGALDAMLAILSARNPARSQTFHSAAASWPWRKPSIR